MLHRKYVGMQTQIDENMRWDLMLVFLQISYQIRNLDFLFLCSKQQPWNFPVGILSSKIHIFSKRDQKKKDLRFYVMSHRET
jgi:hypothetical protein